MNQPLTAEETAALNARIAERIFDWQWLCWKVARSDEWVKAPFPPAYANPYGYVPYTPDRGHLRVSYSATRIPDYASDGNAMLLLIEKIRSTDDAPDQVYFEIIDCSQHGWRVDIGRVVTENDAPVIVGRAVAPTLPLAVALATIAAVEGEQE